MLKINLLPSYIYDKKKALRAIFVFALLAVAVIAGMLAWTMKLSSQQRQLEANIADLTKQCDKVDATNAAADNEEAKIPPLQSKVSFVEGLMKYNVESPKVYKELAKYTYSRVLYRSAQLSGNSLQLQAHCRTLGDYARYLINIYRANHLFSSVSVSASIPAWPDGGRISQRGGLDFSVSCTLAKPLAAPAYGGGGNAAAGGMGMGGGMGAGMGPMMMPGMMPGMGGKMGGKMVGPGMMPGMKGPMMMPGMKGPGMKGPMMMPGMKGPGMMPGMKGK